MGRIERIVILLLAFALALPVIPAGAAIEFTDDGRVVSTGPYDGPGLTATDTACFTAAGIVTTGGTLGGEMLLTAAGIAGVLACGAARVARIRGSNGKSARAVARDLDHHGTLPAGFAF